ncbi:MAG: metal-dependent transcriptional regulator [Methanotrichaceae archaeon]
MKKKLSRKAEDYLEAIFNISQENGYARIRDISKQLGVKPPSVVEMVRKLGDQGYVVHKKYEGVFLTSEGEEVGRVVKDRHDTIKAFLIFINVPEDLADADACTMEHELSSRTVEQIKYLVKFIDLCPENPEWLNHFKIFCDTGRHSCDVMGRLRSAKDDARSKVVNNATAAD